MRWVPVPQVTAGVAAKAVSVSAVSRVCWSRARLSANCTRPFHRQKSGGTITLDGVTRTVIADYS